MARILSNNSHKEARIKDIFFINIFLFHDFQTSQNAMASKKLRSTIDEKMHLDRREND